MMSDQLVGWDYAVVDIDGVIISMHVTVCPKHSEVWLCAALTVGSFGKRVEPRERACVYCSVDPA